jgi:hypothetical protein
MHYTYPAERHKLPRRSWIEQAKFIIIYVTPQIIKCGTIIWRKKIAITLLSAICTDHAYGDTSQDGASPVNCHI